MTEALAWKRWKRTQDRRSREWLLSHYDAYAQITSRRSFWPSAHTNEPQVRLLDQGDLLCIARECLWASFDTYDQDRGTFKTYVVGRMLHACQEAVRVSRVMPRRYQELRSSAHVETAKFVALYGRNPTLKELSGILGASTQTVAHAVGFPAFWPVQDTILRQSSQSGGEALPGDASAYGLSLTMEHTPVERGGLRGHSASDICLWRETTDSLRAAVDALPPRQKALVDRCYYDGERMRDIAKGMGVSEARVHQIRAQALDTLRGACP